MSIEHAADIIAKNFRDFGWTYHDGKELTADRLRKVIAGLSRSALQHEGEAETGRIRAVYNRDAECIGIYMNCGEVEIEEFADEEVGQ